MYAERVWTKTKWTRKTMKKKKSKSVETRNTNELQESIREMTCVKHSLGAEDCTFNRFRIRFLPAIGQASRPHRFTLGLFHVISRLGHFATVNANLQRSPITTTAVASKINIIIIHNTLAFSFFCFGCCKHLQRCVDFAACNKSQYRRKSTSGFVRKSENPLDCRCVCVMGVHRMIRDVRLVTQMEFQP